jgi:hypothetical protein
MCGKRHAARRPAASSFTVSVVSGWPPMPQFAARGEADIAAAALQELRRVQPNTSLAWIASEMPIGSDAERAHYVEAFRRAGLE